MNLFIPVKTTQREHVVILPQLVAASNERDESRKQHKKKETLLLNHIIVGQCIITERGKKQVKSKL